MIFFSGMRRKITSRFELDSRARASMAKWARRYERRRLPAASEKRPDAGPIAPPAVERRAPRRREEGDFSATGKKLAFLSNAFPEVRHLEYQTVRYGVPASVSQLVVQGRPFSTVDAALAALQCLACAGPAEAPAELDKLQRAGAAEARKLAKKWRKHVHANDTRAMLEKLLRVKFCPLHNPRLARGLASTGHLALTGSAAARADDLGVLLEATRRELRACSPTQCTCTRHQ